MQHDSVRAFYRLADDGLHAHAGWEYTLGFAASWTKVIVDGVESVRMLHDNGLGLQAAPIRRSLIEHSACVLAIARDHEAFDSYVRGVQQKTKTMMTSLEEIGLAPTAEMEAILDWVTDDTTRRLDTYLHAKHRFQQMGEAGDRLYVLWLAESQLSHPGFVTAGIYLRDTDGSDFPTLTLDPMVPSSDLTADLVCAESLAMALDGLSTILVGDPLRTVVDTLNRRRNKLVDAYTR